MIVSHKHDAEGNIIGCAHDNPILDSWIYNIEFADGKVTALTSNTITKAMYAHCDFDRNKYIVLAKVIDIRCTDDAITLDQ